MRRQGATNPEPAQGSWRPELRGPGAEMLRLLGYPVVRQVLADLGRRSRRPSEIDLFLLSERPQGHGSYQVTDRGRHAVAELGASARFERRNMASVATPIRTDRDSWSGPCRQGSFDNPG